MRFVAIVLLSVIQSFLLNCFFLPTISEAAAQARPRFPIVFPLLSPRVSSQFGQRIHPIRRFSMYHKGVDLAAPENSHVRAVAAGRVVFAGRYAGFGKLVTIEHKDGYASLYGHLTEILVKTGDEVAAGALIGRVGATGLATGPHLHFEWRLDGRALDPLQAFPALAESADG